MEVLSEVLKAVKLNGALFYNAEFSAPWCAQSVDAHSVISHLSPKSKHVIIFHLLTEGRGYANLKRMICCFLSARETSLSLHSQLAISNFRA